MWSASSGASGEDNAQGFFGRRFQSRLKTGQGMVGCDLGTISFGGLGTSLTTFVGLEIWLSGFCSHSVFMYNLWTLSFTISQEEMGHSALGRISPQLV